MVGPRVIELQIKDALVGINTINPLQLSPRVLLSYYKRYLEDLAVYRQEFEAIDTTSDDPEWKKSHDFIKRFFLDSFPSLRIDLLKKIADIEDKLRNTQV